MISRIYIFGSWLLLVALAQSQTFDFRKVLHETVNFPVDSVVNRRVVIWHGSIKRGSDKSKLDWMYAPMVDTLVRGFLSPPDSSISVEIVAGHSVDELKNSHWIPTTDKKRYSFLRKNDWFIFVGNQESNEVPFAQLTKWGIFTVYYQSEPLLKLTKLTKPTPADVKDVYTYSYGNYGQKPVPCGYFPEKGTQIERVFNQHKMLFVGSTNHPNRQKILQQLKDHKISVDVKTDLWSSEAFNHVLDQYDILIDIHKLVYTASSPQPAEGVRFSQVLSHKPCIIIAERSCEDDERAYEGIVIFTSNIVETFKNISSMPASEFKSLMLSSHAKFRERFDVKKIFQEARIWESFKDNVKTVSLVRRIKKSSQNQIPNSDLPVVTVEIPSDIKNVNFKGVFHQTVNLPTTNNASVVSRRVVIWHGVRSKVTMLDWMYAPMVDTLVRGFLSPPDSNISVEIVAGHSIEELKNSHWIPTTDKKRYSFLRKNDWFIFVGSRDVDGVPFAQLKQMGIFTIYYQSEPLVQLDEQRTRQLNDVYTYTHGHPGQKPVLCGYLPGKDSHIDFGPTKVFNQHKVLFLGGDKYPHRIGVLQMLKNRKITVDTRNNLWSAEAFNRVLDQYDILLDIHKHPYTSKEKQPAEGVRFSQVLSHKPCIIIAERSCEDDENLFEGIVIFTSNFVATVLNISSLPPLEFRSLMLSSHAKFRERFDVKRIFQDARIWESFKDNVKTESIVNISVPSRMNDNQIITEISSDILNADDGNFDFRGVFHESVNLPANNESLISRRVVIWHAVQKFDKSKLDWMYAPVVDTLVRGFLSPPNSSISVEIVAGHSVDELKNSHWIPTTGSAISFLRKNDWFIFVGKPEANTIPFDQLTKMGIFTVYYQTEPGLMLTKPSSADLTDAYTYTYGNSGQKAVPCGYLPDSLSIDEEALELETEKVFNQHKILFVGSTNHPNRQKVLQQLKGHKVTVDVKTDLWNADAFNHVLDQYDILIDIHKLAYTASSPQPAEGVRFSQVLSHKPCIIIAERSCEEDEILYEGIVIFTSNTIETVLNVSSMSPSEFRSLILSSHAKFRERFDVKRIFQEARIWESFTDSIKTESIIKKSVPTQITESDVSDILYTGSENFDFSKVVHETVNFPTTNNASVVSRRVVIWHGGKAKLAWKYEPMVDTLVRGLLSPPDSNYSVDIVIGHSFDMLIKNHWIPTTGSANSFLRKNDWFIFVGIVEANIVPFDQLTKMGIFTVYYQTEPGLMLTELSKPSLADLMDVYTNTYGNPGQKPVLCGYLPEKYTGMESINEIVEVVQNRMLFIGDLDGHSRRQRELQILKNNKITVKVSNDLFDTKTFNRMLDQYDILLDIHKNPNTASSPQPAEGVRFSQVLSHKPCIIIAERSCEDDERAYDGIVIFTSNIVETFKNISSMPASEFRSLMLSSHAKFRERFDVKKIFQEARIWESFKDNVKTEGVFAT